MFIEQIHFVEVDQFNFQVQFLYKGQVLQTGSFPRSTVAADLVPFLQSLCTAFDNQRAQGNFDSLVTNFEGKSVDI